MRRRLFCNINTGMCVGLIRQYKHGTYPRYGYSRLKIIRKLRKHDRNLLPVLLHGWYTDANYAKQCFVVIRVVTR